MLRFRAMKVAGAVGALFVALCAIGGPVATGVWAAPDRQAGVPPGPPPTGPTAAVSYLWAQAASGLFGSPHVTAYVQVFDRADPPAERAGVTGLPAPSFSATEDGAPVSIGVKPVSPDEPVAMIVIADTSTNRGWLGTGPKYPDPIQYLRDTTLRVIKEFPQTGRFALYTMASDASGTPPLGDRAAAETAAQQMQPNSDAILLVRLDQAVAALKDAPPSMRRIIVVLSDGNSQSGRPYEAIQTDAAKNRIAVFAVGTIDSNNPFRFLDRMGLETGGQAWYFDKTQLQPQASSPITLDLLTDQAIKAIKGAYRVDYTPPNSAHEQRSLAVIVKGVGGTDVKAPAAIYLGRAAGGASTSLVLLGTGIPLLLIAAGAGFYFLRLRPAKTDYYLVGHGPSAGHVPEEYLYTEWRALGRGGRGYQLNPEDPHFHGLSKTHVFVRVHNLRRVKGPSGHAQPVGTVEVKAGRPSSGVGLNTTFVYNEITGVRPLSERPYQLQTGDLLILQPASRQGESLNGLPPGVYLRLGHVGGTMVEPSAPAYDQTVVPQYGDPDKTIVETVADGDRTIVESALPPNVGAGPGSRFQAGAQPPAGVSDGTVIGPALRIPPSFPNGVPPDPRRQ